ncbi:MAG: choice-of-anchor J domain-containing protein [Bacteroidales bacterium]|nr:choice-of-anchor J domain-containing protein [Bacteroidales bacterium]
MKRYLLMTLVTLFAFSFMANADEISRMTEFTEGFENGFPSTWTMIDADGDGNNWDLTHYVPAHTGANSMYSYSFDNVVGALTPDNYMVTPMVELVPGSTLSLWASTQDVNFPAEHFGVAVSADGENFTTVAEWDLTAKVAGEWHEYIAYVGDYEGNMYLAIRHFNCTDQFMIKVDDVTLYVGDVPEPCYAPSNLTGEVVYDDEAASYGVQLSWDMPENQPLYYNLYVNDTEIIEIEGGLTSYFDMREDGTYTYRLTAVHEGCESDYALTSDGNDYLEIIVDTESVGELYAEEIVTVTAVYNVNGQRIGSVAVEDLPKGVYIVQGVTENGKTIAKKIVK